VNLQIIWTQGNRLSKDNSIYFKNFENYLYQRSIPYKRGLCFGVFIAD
jgi:hypothetical protein